MTDVIERIVQLAEKLDRIELALQVFVTQPPIKELYTPAEAAEILGKAEFTVREWCRLGRIYADKRECGRGASREWIISREEISRIQNEGLLPLPPKY